MSIALLLALNAARKAILDAAQLSLPPDKFPVFRKVVLHSMGRNGLEREVLRAIESMERDRKG